MKRFLFLLSFTCSHLFAQNEATVRAYIEKYRETAITEMQRANIPASITLAQGIHESSCGKSELAINARNHFGIKCHKEWNGPGYTYDDDRVGECFRIYNNAEESYKDHSDFLTSRARYNSLFDLKVTDYKGWAHGLKAAGYATNPKYAHILIDLIEKYSLHKYDTGQETGQEKSSREPASPAESVVNSTNQQRESFDFHGIRTLIAQGDENPLALATAFNVDYKLLLDYNDLHDGDSFKDGEHIFLQPKRKFGSEKSCIVKPGDSMWLISQRYGIRLSSLYELNRMALNDQPIVGEVLTLKEQRDLPAKSSSYETYLASKDAESENVNPIKEIYYYEVQPKETLYGISKRFGVTPDELIKWNNLPSSDLRTGQTLVVGKKR